MIGSISSMPQTFFVGAAEGSVSALETLRLSAAMVARLNRNGIGSETKTDLMFNLRKVTTAFG